MSYRSLEIWKVAQQLTAEIQRMSLEALPRHEMYEEGSQIRRSIKSVRSNIVEGYGRRRYKQEFVRFLTDAQASCDETRDHLNILKETDSLTDGGLFRALDQRLDHLGRMINRFIRSIEEGHLSVREQGADYGEVVTVNRVESVDDDN